MRITNKIMQNNSLYNLNNNKILQDKLNTQMSTYKKITKPSDDPVIAIRALRLRSTLSEVTQLYEKNIPDAASWLEVTEGAISSITDIVEDLIDKTRDGSNGKLETNDRLKIVEQMKSLRDEIYATGDADYAGRSLFTGYRTGTKLRFQEDTTAHYKITESLTKAAIDTIMYVDKAGIEAVNTTNYDTTVITEQQISSANIDRIRLAYGELDDVIPTFTYVDDNGTTQTITPTVSSSTDQAYRDMAAVNAGNPVEEKAIFIAETGEMLLSDSLSEKLQALSKTAEISVTYEKTNWNRGNLRPEHYFVCEDFTNNMVYETPSSEQEIEYSVGFNQRLRINSTAGEVYTHDIGRDVDELVKLSQQVIDLESLVSTLESVVEAETDETKKIAAQKNLDAANKALTLLRDEQLQFAFENGITAMQGYLEQTTLAITNCGTRSARLELVEARLQTQQTSFKSLVSENEDVDITEVAIQFESSQTAYNAALMATGKVVQNSLLDFL
ncbi:MAG: flagellar hook-associated protein FlgL [Lachnospiraceae bacterium]|nr:flagellar hook-associated protein FlgL [Lachnospiraceae bacterium]